MRNVAVALMLMAGSPAASAGELPGWMAGAWIEKQGESWAEEFWSSARGGILLGAARTGKGEALEFWEQTRIERDPDGTIAFYASPRGVSVSRFPMESQGASEIVFANAAHDYPQRIRYWREGPLLKAEVSKLDGSGTQAWTYAPMGQ
ncbi:MAG TPA: hypothetical protein DCG90_04015 [Sphingobium sp.]|uniref:DUF6265 family protein n=1 Tax=unclassified Sphingobium TaxID=2611147 RepID=UPI000A02DA23|nr:MULTISPECIES: DUF6265 family protein [unclassified Sphingobium]WIW89111.1 DUF6265 family protein [Sphingobium sp. V4]HAF40919.1 hypothetical protein [Sphingobium sp.]